VTKTELMILLLWLKQAELWELPDDPFDPSGWMS